MNNINLLRLPTPALVSILSMLDASEVNIFKRLEKRTNEFYNRHKKMIDCDVMLKKIENDPAALFYLNKSVKKDPIRQEALAAFATDGQILRGRNGAPLLTSLVDAYRDYLSLKNRIKKKVLPTKGPSLSIVGKKNDRPSRVPSLSSVSKKNDPPTGVDTIKFDSLVKKVLKVFDNKLYVSCDWGVQVCDLKTKTITSLEETPRDVSAFKFDKIKKRLYLGGNHLVVWDLTKSKIFKEFTNNSKLSSFLLDNEKVYIGYFCGKIAEFNTETAKIQKEFSVHEDGPITDIKKMGNYLLSFSDKKIKFWNSSNLEFLNEVEVKSAFGCSFVNNYMFLNQACKGDYKNIFVYDISNVKDIQRVGELKDQGHFLKACPAKITLLGNYLFTTVDSPHLFKLPALGKDDQKTVVWSFINSNNEKNFKLIKKYNYKSGYLFRMKPEKQFMCETIIQSKTVRIHDYSSPLPSESIPEKK